MFGRSTKLFDVTGEGGPGGGTGDQPQPLSAEDVAKMVNAAIATHMKRDLGKLIADAIGPVATAVKELQTKQPEAPKVNDDPGKASPELVALQRQLEELRTANKAAEERAAATERKAREERAYGELVGLLNKNSIKPEFVDVLAKSLYYGEKRVEFDEDGRILFRTQAPQYTGGPLQDQLFPLADGVEAFAKSKDAEAYRAAPVQRPPTKPIPRIQGSGSGALPVSDGKIPSTLEDPGWANRVAAELAASGVPTGSIE
jgi:hypothetical protein